LSVLPTGVIFGILLQEDIVLQGTFMMKHYFLLSSFLFGIHSACAMKVFLHLGQLDNYADNGFIVKNFFDKQERNDQFTKLNGDDYKLAEGSSGQMCRESLLRYNSPARQQTSKPLIPNENQAQQFMNVLLDKIETQRNSDDSWLEPKNVSLISWEGKRYLARRPYSELYRCGCCKEICEKEKQNCVDSSIKTLVGAVREYTGPSVDIATLSTDSWFWRVHEISQQVPVAKVVYCKPSENWEFLGVTLENRSSSYMSSKRTQIELKKMRIVGALAAVTGAAAWVWKSFLHRSS
jgi:hypothetical protein